MTSHECMKCKAVGDWTEVYYDEFLCGICINGKCDVCQCDIIDRQHGMDFCEPCFDRFKITNARQSAPMHTKQILFAFQHPQKLKHTYPNQPKIP